MIQKTRKAILNFQILIFAVGPKDYGNAIASNASAEKIVGVISSLVNFTNLAQELEEVRLNSTPEGPCPYTAFVPSDQAFSTLPSSQFYALKANRSLRRAVLSYHIVPG